MTSLQEKLADIIEFTPVQDQTHSIDITDLIVTLKQEGESFVAFAIESLGPTIGT